MNIFTRVALACLLAPLGTFAHAQVDTTTPTKPTAESGQIWLTSGFRSYHLNRSKDFNETNTGLGIEYTLSEESTIIAGHFSNSHNRPSTYLNCVYTPLELGPIRLGVSAGVVSGYRYYDEKFGPMLVPAATTKFKIFDHDVGLNVTYVPKISDRLNSAIAIQFKVRVY